MFYILHLKVLVLSDQLLELLLVQFFPLSVIALSYLPLKICIQKHHILVESLVNL